MSTNIELKDFHWLIDMVHNIDIGLAIIDLQFNVKVWNGFMENHSGLLTAHMVDKKITDVFTSIPEDWLQQKINSVCLLKNKAYTTWEQRPYLFKFKSYRPITSEAEFMYQNVTFLPLTDIRGNVTQVCMIIYDVTDVALNRLALQKANQRLQYLSHTDILTQLNNQGYWRERCEMEFKRHQRTQQTASIISLDIDNFKAINDTYGHPFGDHVIQSVADILRNNQRISDVAGRIGGEEFALLLVDTDLAGATVVAQRIRKSIEQACLDFRGETVKITASLGVAQMDTNISDFQALLNIVDLGLYSAKNNGRNQVGIKQV